MPPSTVTPIRQQYLQIKKRYPDAILFFRLGDFYETFDHDAEIVSQELDVVLTSRSMGKGQRVPMAGVPHHAADGYIADLIARGHKVAVCEQMSDEPVKGLMPREVVRVVTPGTVVEPAMLADKRNNYIAALVLDDGVESNAGVGIAYADITTGEFATTQIDHRSPLEAAVRELDRLAPAEIVVGDGGEAYVGPPEARAKEAARRYPRLAELGVLALYDQWRFEEGGCRQALLQHLRVSSLAGFGCEDKPLAIRAAGVIVQYLGQHQSAALAQLDSLATYSTDDFMTLDVATRRNLELTETIREHGGRRDRAQGSLLWVLDETRTPMGGRLLRRWLTQPLLNREALEERLSAVDICFHHLAARTALAEQLRGMGDLERLTNRLIQRIAGPRDLLGIKAALERVAAIGERIAQMAALAEEKIEEFVYPMDRASLAPMPALVELLDRALVDDPPASISQGGAIRPGYSAELDGIASSVAEAKQWVAGLERAERERTGIKSLKVGYNKVFGYYLEVTKANAEAVPEEYIRKQTLVNAERYITPELKDREALILHAEERSQELEAQLFAELLEDAAVHTEALLATARAVAHLDVYVALADVAAAYNYVRPELVDGDDMGIEIVAGRHPVVERTLLDKAFVPNDTCLGCDHDTIHIITGPNMSGKSTYLRQVALITLMAQIGSFVPADAARIGLVDRIFARVGAQDEIAAGQSTFMVEMVELANILNHATSRSLLILDEIGRGTSTYDGISIAWAAVEYLHNHPRLGPKTLFATHYHELTELEGFLPRVRNYNVSVVSGAGTGGGVDTPDDVVFTHHIVPGGADRSYGIHVGRMAGLPTAVTQRAQEILTDLQSASQRVPVGGGQKVIHVKQLALFRDSHPVVDALRELDVSAMSPLEALNTLYKLQQEIE
jgi:DNA mismatch repair protein MutS